MADRDRHFRVSWRNPFRRIAVPHLSRFRATEHVSRRETRASRFWALKHATAGGRIWHFPFSLLVCCQGAIPVSRGSSSWGDLFRTFCWTVARKDESCSSRNEVQIKNAPFDPRGLSSGEKLNHWWNNFISFIFFLLANRRIGKKRQIYFLSLPPVRDYRSYLIVPTSKSLWSAIRLLLLHFVKCERYYILRYQKSIIWD